MTAKQLYDQNIKPLSTCDTLTIARLIIDEIKAKELAGEPVAGSGFDYLKRMLPQIERTAVTDQELAAVDLSGSAAE